MPVFQPANADQILCKQNQRELLAQQRVRLAGMP
jgi:hypothetical protein